MIDPTSLHGSWRLERFVITYDDGRPELHPFGEDATGLLTYTPDGWMSAILSRAGRPSLGVGGLETTGRADAASKAAAFDSYLSYAGRWAVEGDAVVHRVTLALAPDAVGLDNVREAALDGDRLTLTYQRTPRSGVTRHYNLIWRRN